MRHTNISLIVDGGAKEIQRHAKVLPAIENDLIINYKNMEVEFYEN